MAEVWLRFRERAIILEMFSLPQPRANLRVAPSAATRFYRVSPRVIVVTAAIRKTKRCERDGARLEWGCHHLLAGQRLNLQCCSCLLSYGPLCPTSSCPLTLSTFKVRCALCLSNSSFFILRRFRCCFVAFCGRLNLSAPRKLETIALQWSHRVRLTRGFSNAQKGSTTKAPITFSEFKIKLIASILFACFHLICSLPGCL